MAAYSCVKKEKRCGPQFLITITVNGSSGPIRFPVDEEELVYAVIAMALKKYAKEGRFPVLGTDLDGFRLRCVNFGYNALSPWEPIGSCGSRNFILYKEEREEHANSADSEMRKKASWKALVVKSLRLKSLPH